MILLFAIPRCGTISLLNLTIIFISGYSGIILKIEKESLWVEMTRTVFLSKIRSCLFQWAKTFLTFLLLLDQTSLSSKPLFYPWLRRSLSGQLSLQVHLVFDLTFSFWFYFSIWFLGLNFLHIIFKIFQLRLD